MYLLNKRLGWHQNRFGRFVEEGQTSLLCWETKQDPGQPTLKLVTILTPKFRPTEELKDHRLGYPRTVVLETISPLMKIVKPRKKMVG